MAMDLDDYFKGRMLEDEGRHKGWGLTTAAYLIVAAIVIAFFVYLWQHNSNEKAQFATGIARLDGRLDAIEPAVTAQGNNLYRLNGAFSASAQGVKDLKESVDNQLYELNDEVFYNPGRRGHRSGGGGCGGGREFRQQQTYNLASTTVTVDDVCRGC